MSASAAPDHVQSNSSADVAVAGVGLDCNEEDVEARLRRTLRLRLHNLYRRGPLEPTYKHFLQRSAPLAPSSSKFKQAEKQVIKFPRDKLYKKVGGEMRRSVELYMENPASGMRKRGRDRDDLEDEAMRASFTLRECKKHEQESLIATAIAADVYAGPNPGGFVPTPGQVLIRRRNLEGTALMLQEQERKEQKQQARIKAERARAVSRLLERERAQAQAEIERFKEERERQKGPESVADKVRVKEEQIRRREEDMRQKQEQMEHELREKEREIAAERARERERERELEMKKEEDERRKRLEREKEEAERKARMAETPQQALRRLYDPIFQALWNMEFDFLDGTNPFRIVIDAENCAMMGAPDYCEVIKRPMNLSYIQDKVRNQKYESLQQFFSDVELMISNALLYNSDPKNPYHVAAKEIKRKYKKMAKKVVVSLQQAQQQHKQSGK